MDHELKWRPMSECPVDDQNWIEVLISVGRRVAFGRRYMDGGDVWYCVRSDEEFETVHPDAWMPVPKPFKVTPDAGTGDKT
jgi:hypothetical protein